MIPVLVEWLAEDYESRSVEISIDVTGIEWSDTERDVRTGLDVSYTVKLHEVYYFGAGENQWTTLVHHGEAQHLEDAVTLALEQRADSAAALAS